MTPPEPSRPAAPRRVLGLPPRISLGFGAAIATLALAKRTEAAGHVEHTAACRRAIEGVESALLVSHTSLDAYLGTRDPRHRARHESAAAKLDASVVELVRLADDLPDEREPLRALLPALEILREDHGRALALADRGDFPAALALRERGDRADALERAKAAVDALEQRVADEILRNQTMFQSTAVVSYVVLLAANGVLLVLVGLAARLVRDEIRARERNEAARERALAVQKRLMAMVSHDLRNPLAGILAAGWALARSHLADDQAHMARRIVGAGRRMERLIRDLLDWSRVHGGAPIPLSLRDADLYGVCERVAGEMADRRGGDRVRLAREGDTTAVFDPDRMEQIVANLVQNALKYSPPSAPVHVRAVGEGDEVRVEVRDEGPGIPAEAQTELFRPFHRLGLDDDATSLGLGLFIVRTLAGAHGARIEVDSAAGRGTTFVVRLPRRAPASQPRTATGA